MRFNSIFIFLLLSISLYAQDVTVTVQNNTFTPADITINVGETVEWDNVQGFHNVNGTQTAYPANPEGFGNGGATMAPWQFSHTFTQAGSYQYHCDPHVSFGMAGTITVVPTPEDDILISGVMDGPLSGGTPKVIELTVLENIPDLSRYSVGSANNGMGSDGPEFTFPVVAANMGDCIYIVSDTLNQFSAFFGFPANYISGAANINGDDAIELFLDSTTVIDVFGDINVDGTGQPWEYMDGWVYRINGTGPDGDVFDPANWTYSGVDALDGEMNNATAATPFPTCEYMNVPPELNANDDVVSTNLNTAITIDVLNNDLTPFGVNTLTVISGPTDGMAVVNGTTDITYTPNTDFCGTDVFMYEVCEPFLCDTATVTVEVICPSNYPKYNISTVTTIDTSGSPDSIDVTCELEGIVHGIDLQVSNNIQFVLIDGTGGIMVFSNDDFGYTVTEGDHVILRGKIEEFFCLTQIRPDTLWLVGQNNPLANPTIVTTPLDESHESELIRINDVELVTPSQWTGSGSFNVDITDGTNVYAMRIDDATDISMTGMAAPTGPFDVIGLGGQFDNMGDCDEGYQFLPRYIPDIMLIINTKEQELANAITVFPNPVNDVLNIDIRGNIAVEKIQVTNALGQLIYSSKNTNTTMLTIPTATWQPGVYMATFYTADAQWTERVVKR